MCNWDRRNENIRQGRHEWTDYGLFWDRRCVQVFYELHRSGAQPTMVCLSEYQFGQIRSFIHDELCQRNQLVPEAFPITERVLTKRGSPCGMFFCLHGPRSVRFTAVYDMFEAKVLFYDSNGQRTGSHEFATALQHAN